jgi:hypothetical protein
MRAGPDRHPLCEQRQSFRREGEQPPAPVGRIDRDREQPAPLERLQIGGEGGAIHRQQLRDRPERRRGRAVERHQQRELPAGEAERPERRIERRASARAARWLCRQRQ